MSEARTTVLFSEVGVTVVYGPWICAASGRRFFSNSGTWHRNFQQTTCDVALGLFQDHLHQIRDDFRDISLFSGNRL
jgi:hypothetical protein